MIRGLRCSQGGDTKIKLFLSVLVGSGSDIVAHNSPGLCGLAVLLSDDGFMPEYSRWIFTYNAKALRLRGAEGEASCQWST